MIRPFDEAAAGAARERQAQLLKPPGSLGRLEEIAVWMAGVTGHPTPSLRPRIVIAAADHGVAAEGVSAYPQEVTAQMLSAFLNGQSAVAVLAGEVGADVVVVDAGVAGATPSGVVSTGLQPSGNIVVEAALDDASFRTAMSVGRGLAAQAASEGINLLVGGEMGIANTTPATCLAAWLTQREASTLCGRGTGVDDAGLTRKRRAVMRTLELHGRTAKDPLHALRLMGGGEIAVLCGLALGAGEHGLGFVCDGLIATAAVAVAAAAEPDLSPRLLAGHRSPEPAHGALLDLLALAPVLDLGMRLGEGSGATAALSIVSLASATHRAMATFEEAAVSGPGS